jgi:hypothetical protein
LHATERNLPYGKRNLTFEDTSIPAALGCS